MRIMVLNKASEVGKSTVARHMLAGPIKAMLISVVGPDEPDAHPEGRCIRKTATDMPKILSNLANIPSAVVDVSSGAYEDVVAQLGAVDKYHQVFDYIVIPVTSEYAAQRATVDTLVALANHWVPAQKIRVLFNMLEWGDDVYAEFAALLEYYAIGYNDDRPKFAFRPDAILKKHAEFRILRLNGSTFPVMIENARKIGYAEDLASVGIPRNEADRLKVEVLEKVLENTRTMGRIEQEMARTRTELLS